MVGAGAGSPLSGAKIEVAAGVDAGRSATSGTDGRYTLTGLHTGELSIRVSADGHEPQTAELTLSADTTLSFELAPTPSASAPGITVTGAVTDRDTGAGIAGAAVATVDGANARRAVAADASGHFSLAGLAPGSVTVTASAVGYSTTGQVRITTVDWTVSVQLARLSPPPAPPPLPTGTTAITFAGLTTPGAAVADYVESGYTVSPSGGWAAQLQVGQPAPEIDFAATAGTTATGEVQIRSVTGSPFYFSSLDLFSLAGSMSYTFTGTRNGTPVFRQTDTPGPWMGFRTFQGPTPAGPIDTLSIEIVGRAIACCDVTTGLDNVVLTLGPPSR